MTNRFVMVISCHNFKYLIVNMDMIDYRFSEIDFLNGHKFRKNEQTAWGQGNIQNPKKVGLFDQSI